MESGQYKESDEKSADLHNQNLNVLRGNEDIDGKQEIHEVINKINSEDQAVLVGAFSEIIKLYNENNQLDFSVYLKPLQHPILLSCLMNTEKQEIAYGASILLRSIVRNLKKESKVIFYESFAEQIQETIGFILENCPDSHVIANTLTVIIEFQTLYEQRYPLEEEIIIAFIRRWKDITDLEDELMIQRTCLFIIYYISYHPIEASTVNAIIDALGENNEILNLIKAPNTRKLFCFMLDSLIRNTKMFDYNHFYSLQFLDLIFKWKEEKNPDAISLLTYLITSRSFPKLIDFGFFLSILKITEDPSIISQILYRQYELMNENERQIKEFIDNGYTKVLLELSSDYQFNCKKPALMIFSLIIQLGASLIEDQLDDILEFLLSNFEIDDELDECILRTILTLFENEKFKDLISGKLEDYSNITEMISDDTNHIDNKSIKDVIENLKKYYEESDDGD